MNVIDRVVATFSPVAGLRRAQARKALDYYGATTAHYDAAKPSRNRRMSRDKMSGDMLIWKAAPVMRDQARELERNYDIARGILNVLVNKTIGPNGITIEPLPRTKSGDIHEDFAQQLLRLWKNWSKTPEVTRTMSWATAQQMMARTWFRDGECFAQVLEGAVRKLDHGTTVPLSLELLEPDLCPFEFYDPALNIWQGIQRNGWGQPTNYYVYKGYPGDKFYFPAINQVKAIGADRMLHVAVRDRISQLRGVTQFASIITRLDDIKDYEESERVAAKIAASMAAYIKKGDPNMYGVGAIDPNATDIETSRRLMKFQAGMIFDDLQPGEEIGLIDSKRPNVNLESFRSGQLRAVASGTGGSYSSISKNYMGTYSSQRQEMVDTFDAYQSLTGVFISRVAAPVWERFVNLALATRLVSVPADLDLDTVTEAFYQGPQMPWIDPLKEAQAQRMIVRCGFKSSAQVVRERGSNIHDVYDALARERRKAQDLGLALESDPAAANATTASVATAAATPAIDLDDAGQPDPNDIESGDTSAPTAQ